MFCEDKDFSLHFTMLWVMLRNTFRVLTRSVAYVFALFGQHRWHIDVHDDENFHTYQSVKLKHDGFGDGGFMT